MIARFLLTEDLADFIWHAACAAVEACGGGNPVACLSRGRRGWHDTAEARLVMLSLARTSLWCQWDHDNGTILTFAIHCGGGRPDALRGFRRPGSPVLADLFGMDHSGIIRQRRESRKIQKLVATARATLRSWYPREPVFTVVKVESSR